ncbi:3-hydroxyacyl-CoA dehydrogenase family protein [Rubripirellula amarantea]|nr:3-hydroxyacyl-CoA dehydrogenase family protein [Rubripirellula amarantea]
MKPPSFDQPLGPDPRITLVGAGVVGQAILRAHVAAGLSVRICDQDAASLNRAIEIVDMNPEHWQIIQGNEFGDLPCIELVSSRDRTESTLSRIVIESIPERLDLKRSFFAEIESHVDNNTVLCTNTSTLRIGEIASAISDPTRFCGMHFFMPVENRNAVELICGDRTSDACLAVATQHIRNLRKVPLVVRDTPGFIVNRLLSPYLNESLQLLCRGISAERIEAAALNYGMPISPLELIDNIGTRTMFDAGRVYWQSFPDRIDPSPMLAGLVKSKRAGKYVGTGIYDYDRSGNRSAEIAEITKTLIHRYRLDDVELTDQEITDRLSIPMWIEAAIATKEGTVNDIEQFDTAMRGGLGYAPEQSWLDFFDHLGSNHILNAISRWSKHSKAMVAPEAIAAALSNFEPSRALHELRTQ